MNLPPTLDLCGLRCPLPVLRTRKAMRLLAHGAEMIVLSTDPLAELDLPHMAAEDGHAILRQWRDGAVVGLHLRKGACGAT